MSDLRVIVVGAGRQGKRRAHAVTQAGGLRLQKVVDIDGSAADLLARQYGCSSAQDWEQAVGEGEADVVIVCTPTVAHGPLACRAMKAGMHVLVEKPLAATPEEARQMVAVAAATGRTLKTGFNFPFRAPMRAGLDLVRDGFIGKVHVTRARAGHARFVREPAAWFCRRGLAGGGALLDLGAHLADVGRRLFGSFDSVTAWVGNGVLPEAEVEDSGEARFVTRDGRPFGVFVSWGDFRSFLGVQVEVFGEKGRVAIDFTARTTCLVTRSGQSFRAEFPREEPDPSWALELREFRDAIREGRPPDGDGRDGLAAVEMIAAAYRSAALHGQVVPVGEEAG